MLALDHRAFVMGLAEASVFGLASAARVSTHAVHPTGNWRIG